MSDLARKMENLRNQVQVRWSDDRSDAVERGMIRRGRRRAQVRRVAGAALALAVLAGGAAMWRRAQPPAQAPVMAQARPVAQPQAILLADGSRAVGTDLQSVLSAKVTLPELTVIGVSRGGGRFQVTPNAGRVFRVEAREVAVETIGTEFTVQLTDSKVLVSVAEGRVKVMWADQVVELDEAHSALFPPDAPPAAVVVAPPAPVVVEPVVQQPVRAPSVKRHVEAPVAPTWRSLSEAGDYDRAYQLLSANRVSLSDPEELIKASEVMRFSNHSEEALPLLRKVTREHRDDRQAPVAAFTLGRMLLEVLGRPREAAEAFADARAIDPRFQMAEDALYREVQSWSRAGDTEKARERAEEYLRAFPQGAHLRAVKSFGGIK
jgi:transmembrane sensor